MGSLWRRAWGEARGYGVSSQGPSLEFPFMKGCHTLLTNLRFHPAHLQAQRVIICVSFKSTRSESRLPCSRSCSPTCWLQACEQDHVSQPLSLSIKRGCMCSFDKYLFCTYSAPEILLVYTRRLGIQQWTKQIKIPDLEYNVYKMGPEHLVTPETKKAIQHHDKKSRQPTRRDSYWSRKNISKT